MWTVSAFVPSSLRKPILGTLTATWTNGADTFVFIGSVNVRRSASVNEFLVQAKRALALHVAASVAPMKGPKTISKWVEDGLNA